MEQGIPETVGRLMLVCSAGGHLEQLLRLRPMWSAMDRVWVCLDKPDARARLADERVVWAHGPTNRRPDNLVRNLGLARRALGAFQPDWVLSNGAGVAPPFFVVARVIGIPTVYMEVVDRIDSASLAGRLCAPMATRVVVQTSQQLASYPSATVLGPLW